MILRKQEINPICQILFLIIFLIFFSSCEKEDDAPSLGCLVCGTPDRLPADIVSLEHVYVSGEFLDVDNDGDLDFVLGAWGGDPNYPSLPEEPTDRLLLNNGKGYFTDAPTGSMPAKLFSGGWSGATDIAPIDVNNDGHMDMLLASWGASDNAYGDEETKIQLLMNDGTGKFIDETSLIEINAKYNHHGYLSTADFDGDGLMDFATALYSWRNTGSGFEMRTEQGGGYKAIADIDGDSLPDIIYQYLINSNFDEQGLPNIDWGDMIAFDADGDNDNDLFLMELDGAGVSAIPIKLLLNDGTGKFSYADQSVFQPVPPQFYFADASPADFNGDGLIDIFIQEGGTDLEPFPGGQNRILIQKPGGVFVDETSQRLPQYNDYSHHHAIGDIDNDGDLDIFNNSTTAGDHVSPGLLLNDGNGFFTEEW